MIVTFLHKRCCRHLRGRHIKAAGGIFHMHQFIVITSRRDPTHAQARRNAFTERTAQQHSPVDIPGMNGPRARILRCQFAVDIIFKNHNIMTLSERENSPFARVRHNKSQRIITVWHQNDAFNRPLFQRQFQRFNADASFWIGWDFNHFHAHTAQHLH
ncbi:Uncharacterised protein [Escherichia coli]|nr:Uncharacterised protein [Escherichia coli]